MFKVDKAMYSIVEPFLTEENRYLPLLEDFIRQEKEADIYADSEKDPKAFFVLSRTNWAYLVGEKNESFQKDILDFLYREQRDFYIWFGVGSSWIRENEENFDRFELGDYPRYQFRFEPGRFSQNKRNDIRYKPQVIDETNIDAACQFASSIHDFYENPEAFMKKGIGFLIMEGDRVIGEVVSASVSGRGEVEMDIHTAEEYQSRGIGTCLGEAFIDKCLREQMIPKWDCMISNVASAKLANKLGFTIVKEYPVVCLVTKKKVCKGL